MNVFVTPAYESVKLPADTGMAELREMFPEGKADALNFCIFSTSGTHGSYLTIEDVEKTIDEGDPCPLTVLVIQPRVVRMLYGSISVEKNDIPFLKGLRDSSKAAVLDWF